jgi:putative transcriptional regulator
VEWENGHSAQTDVEMKNRIRVLRAERGWSQAELADRVRVSRNSINAVENGRFDPSLPLAFRVADVFGLSVEEVFDKTDAWPDIKERAFGSCEPTSLNNPATASSEAIRDRAAARSLALHRVLAHRERAPATGTVQ